MGRYGELTVHVSQPDAVRGAVTVTACIGEVCGDAVYDGHAAQVTVSMPAASSDLTKIQGQKSSVTFKSKAQSTVLQKKFSGISGTVTSTGGDCPQDVWKGSVTV